MLLAPLVSSFYPFAYNYAIKLFLDIMDKNEAPSIASMSTPILLFVITQLTLDMVWRISSIAEWKSEPYVRRSILLRSYAYVQNHSFEFFQDNFAGAISSKLKGLLDGYDKFWAEMHHGLLQKICKITVSLFALLFTNYQLGAFVFGWGLVYLPVMYTLSKRLNSLSFMESQSRHKIIGNISDKISNITSIMSFATERLEKRLLNDELTTEYIPRQVKSYKYDFCIQIIGGLLYLTMFGFILFFMLYLKSKNQITIGDFAFVFGIAIIIAEDLWHTTVSLQEFSRVMGDLRSAMTILQEPQQSLDLPDATILNLQKPSIQFLDVSFSYTKTKLVFDSLNLNIKAGEKVGLVGHSGSGKSTIVNLLLRYFENSGGQILVDGKEISKLNKSSLRDAIAVIPQDTSLFHRNLMENIRYGKLDASDEEVIAAAKKAHIHDFIQTLPEGYETFVGEKGVKLSGGQRQRISIARAILKDAKILVLDEATSSLDSQTESLIQESLNLFINDTEKTVIAIAHRLATLKHMDRIIVLDKGKIVSEGTHGELITGDNNLYRKLWELQEICIEQPRG